MPRNFAQSVLDGLKKRAITLGYCVRIERNDGQVIARTDCGLKLDVEGQTYAPGLPFQISNRRFSAGMRPANCEIEGALDATPFITESLIRSRFFENANVKIGRVNYLRPQDGFIDVIEGRIGNADVQGATYRFEVLGFASLLDADLLRLYQPRCKHKLGDARCKVNLDDYRYDCLVDDLSERTLTIDPSGSTLLTGGEYRYGTVTFVSGPSAGQSVEIVEDNYASSGTVKIGLPMPFGANRGDSIQVFVGCDKTIETCIGRFNNATNHGGFPYAPTPDEVNQYDTSTGR